MQVSEMTNKAECIPHRGEEIEGFFDKESIRRDVVLRDPILKYEQDMRQKAVVELIEPKEGELMLDIGCGSARDLIVFANSGAICVGIDFSSGMLSQGREVINKTEAKNVHLIRADASKLPFKSAVFDKVSCSEVIEHLPNWENAIAEMNRVLKIGARLVVTTPNRHSLYGFTKKLTDSLRLVGITLHPYDEWKTQNEVTTILERCDMVVDKKIGICFIPGVLTYLLPRGAKKLVVKISSQIEKRLRSRFTGKGYMIGLHAVKKVKV